jgi:imidazolonepropionase-like amidohydrolase
MRLTIARMVLMVSLASAGCAHEQETRPLIDWSASLAPTPASVVVYRDVRVFPATGPSDVLEHQDVFVRGTRIAALHPTGTMALPEGAIVVDGAGKTLMPGLVDAHGHAQLSGSAPWYSVVANPQHNLEEHLYAGTTTMHDMGGRLDHALALKRRVQDGEIAGPRLRVAGPFFTSPGGYPESYISRVTPLPSALVAVAMDPYLRRVDHPRDARRAVRALAAAGVDHIKLAMASTPDGTRVFDPILLEAITDAAHDEGLRVMAHVDTAANARRAIEGGVDVLVHGVHSTDLSDDDARAIAHRGSQTILVAPTLITFERLWQLAHDKLVFTPMENETVASNLRASLAHRPADFALEASLTSWLAHLSTHRDARLGSNVKKLHDAGARILVGTDGHGSTASFPAGIHEEMRLLVAAGLTPGEVLMGATAWSARVSDPAPTYGTIAPGLDADLLLLACDPTKDIACTSRIVEVVARGRRVKRIAP